MVMTELECIREACKEYKKTVHGNGPDGTPGLNDKFSEEDFYKCITDNLDEFRKEILEHPFFSQLEKESIVDVYNQSWSLFMYCLQTFINRKIGFVNEFNLTSPNSDGNGLVFDTIKEGDNEAVIAKQNKKEFVKEVLDGVPRKKSLKEFFDDPRSYKQYRDDFDQAILYMDWDKIHRVMKKLKWGWYNWEDESGDEHEGTVPSVYGIRENAIKQVKDMEKWIGTHPDATEYRSGTGGFEIEMFMCNVKDDPDDYTHQVRFIIRFVVEQFDNGM